YGQPSEAGSARKAAQPSRVANRARRLNSPAAQFLHSGDAAQTVLLAPGRSLMVNRLQNRGYFHGSASSEVQVKENTAQPVSAAPARPDAFAPDEFEYLP
nr:hypothetical protein [Tanacetum cinerariifolium]GFC92744.1 hypothetical protein [Tanacetum cinerariifolium]